MQVTFRAISSSIHLPNKLQNSKFKTSYSATLKLLSRELEHLRAESVVIQLDCDPSQIRIDGMPKAEARTKSALVVLSFQSQHGQLNYPCNTYKTWQDNLRAIALGLEHLRAINRYGISSHGEQYKGWKCLTYQGSGNYQLPSDAAAYLLSQSGSTDGTKADDLLKSWDAVKLCHRRAVAKFHPDHNPGSETIFKDVTESFETLRRHHGK